MPLAETIAAMKHLQSVGKVRFVGICNHSLSDTKTWYESGILSSYQGLYNLIDHNPTEFHGTPLPYRTEDEILPFVRETGIAFFPYCPLAQGLLSGKYQHTDTMSRHDVRWSYSHFKNAKAGILSEQIRSLPKQEILQAAFSFLTNKSEVTSVITGMSSVEQVQENLKWF
ncbi:MAG: aldo/keto reductase [Spirochaetales bacterium]|nr:aldo/keto reductase [Spirochaetales bacterium]